MTYYLIDYENTNSKGLKGSGKLKKCDRIFIFYSENASKINLDFFASHGKAKVRAIKVPARKQSLDMHIASYIGYLIGKHRKKPADCECKYIIISMDDDYDNIISFWKKQGINILRRETISDKPMKMYTDPEYEKLEIKLFGYFDNQADVEAVMTMVEKGTSKVAINNMIMARFKKGEVAKEIYEIINPYIANKPNQNKS